jgi:Mg2+ and Co2+ transporter CorA
MLSNITQNDAEYTAAIAVDGKRDSIAMRTISILGIVYLPPTFVATLFSVDMFDWGPSADGNGAMELRASPSVWIYCAVAVPLTLATFLVWMLWARRENRKSSQRFMVYRTRTNEHGDAVSRTASTARFVSSEKFVRGV